MRLWIRFFLFEALDGNFNNIRWRSPSDNMRLTRPLTAPARNREHLDCWFTGERWRVRTWRSLIYLVLVVKLVVCHLFGGRFAPCRVAAERYVRFCGGITDNSLK